MRSVPAAVSRVLTTGPWSRSCPDATRPRSPRTWPAAGLRDAHADARRTADALAALGLPAGSARDLGFAGLVTGDAADVDGYLERVLGPVAAHDARRGTDLLATLEAYFAAGSSPTRAAGALHVHVNTVAQRLERIAALLGEDWQTPDRALEIQLALRLRRLRAG
jgi:DNA-binding PucR family transcriptional regulator